MLKILEQMKETIESETETPFNDADIAYLEQIKGVTDLATFDKSNTYLRDLAFDAGMALGLTEAEAEAIAYPAPVVEPVVKVDEAELAAEYDRLSRSYSASMSCLQDAEYNLIEEISAEGFASAETRQTKEHYEAEAQADLAKLNSFKANNAALVEAIKKERSEANHKAMWNS
jgi:hypothetical protein